MGGRIRSHDWSATALGPVDSWPRPLRTAVDVMLGAAAPIGICWGPDLVLLYNDAWRRLIGARHPDALGRPAREVFAETWDKIGPVLDSVLAGHGAAAAEDQLVRLDREGMIEEAWFSFTANPIPLDDGTVGGILNIAQETTAALKAAEQVRHRKARERLLLDLSDTLRAQAPALTKTTEVSRLLAEHLGADHAVYCDMRAGGRRIEGVYSRGSSASAPQVPEDDFWQGLMDRAAEAGGPLVAPGPDDARSSAGDGGRGACVAVPVFRDGAPSAGLAVRAAEPRDWTAEEISLIAEVATRTETALERVRTEERLAKELEAAKLIQRLSGLLISADDPQALFDRIVEVAAAVMGSDGASIQILDSTGDRLELAASRGFHPDSARFWQSVDAGSASTCGEALRLGRRVLVPDVEASAFMEGTDDLEHYLRSGLRAVQSTPLATRGGQPIGMISTHWRTPRPLKEADFALFDVLARQAAELIERTQSESDARKGEDRQRFLLKLSDAMRAESDADAQAELALEMLSDKLGTDRCYVCVFRLDEDKGEIACQVGNDRVPPLPASVRLSDFSDALRMASEETMVLHNVPRDESLSEIDRESLGQLGLGAFVAATLRRGESTPLWSLVAVSARPRRWTPDEVALIEAVSERIWTTGERTRAEAAQRFSEERYRALFEAIDVGFCVTEFRFDTDGGRSDYRVLEANPAFYKHTGFPQEILGRWLREAAPDLEEHWYENYGRVARTREPVRFEQKSDMLGRWFEVYAFPIGDPEGLHVAVLFTDISERKHAEDHQNMLMAELDHRVKNILAVVQSIARQSLGRGAANSSDAAERLVGRINTLARSHALLAGSRWRGAEFGQVLDTAIAAYRGRGRVVAEGPDLKVTPKAAQTLNLAFHELVTNAAKYGGLSRPEGSVRIDWHLSGSDEDERLTLRWVESGGPPILAAPDRRGFGSTLIEQTLRHELSGEVTLDFAREGLRALIDLPTKRVRARTGKGTPKRRKKAQPIPSEPGSLHEKRVLLVEDEYLVGQETAETLRSAGCDVTGPIGTLPEALRLAVTEDVDAAVLDVNLGGEFVWPAARALKARGIPLVFATGYSDSISTPPGLENIPRIEKPLAPGRVIAALSAALTRGAGR